MHAWYIDPTNTYISIQNDKNKSNSFIASAFVGMFGGMGFEY